MYKSIGACSVCARLNLSAVCLPEQKKDVERLSGILVSRGCIVRTEREIHFLLFSKSSQLPVTKLGQREDKVKGKRQWWSLETHIHSALRTSGGTENLSTVTLVPENMRRLRIMLY